MLIGDPKQAIYAFRGADVHTYLDAAADAGTIATLGRNWRSDQALVEAYDALFDGLTLGHPGHRVPHRAGRRGPSRRRAPGRAARCGAADPGRAPRRRSRRADARRAGRATRRPARRSPPISPPTSSSCCRRAPSSSRATRSAPRSRPSRVGPGDIAVLVATHRHGGARARRARRRSACRPSSPAPAACSAPRSPGSGWPCSRRSNGRRRSARVHAAALSSFVGWSVERVATADDAAWEDVYVRLHEWAAVLRDPRRRVAARDRSRASERLPARLLSREDGERELTDLRHIGQLLHHEATTERLGVTALTGVAAGRIARGRPTTCTTRTAAGGSSPTPPPSRS